MKLIEAPDMNEKLEKGYNVLLYRLIDGTQYVEAFKSKQAMGKQDAGRIIHYKLWFQTARTRPQPGDHVLVFHKTRTDKFELSKDRKIEQSRV